MNIRPKPFAVGAKFAYNFLLKSKITNFMKKNLLLIILTLLPFAGILGSNLTLFDLRCEYRQNPLGIDTQSPRLFWKLNSQQRGQRQKAYQVLVATSEENLAKDKGDVWDSKKTRSGQSAFVKFSGGKLKSRQYYFWKVRVWDTNGGPSAWSETAKFSTGIMAPDQWKAQWISAPNEQYVAGPAYYFRKEIALDKDIRQATVFISSMGWNELYINGTKVGNHVMRNPFSDINKRVLYETLPLDGLLKKGSNAISVILGNGHHSPPFAQGGDRPDSVITPGSTGTGYHNRFGRFGGPKLLAEIDIEFTDGTHQFIGTDNTWAWNTGEITFNDIWKGEKYDASKTNTGWQNINFSNPAWKPVAVFPNPAGKMEASIVMPNRRFEVLKPYKADSNKFYFDTLTAGWPVLKIAGEPGQKINISGAINTEFKVPPLEYILKGNGIETLEPKFYFNTAANVFTVTGPKEFLSKDALTFQTCHADLEKTGEFSCSNTFFNGIYNALIRSHLNYTFDHPMDPTREKEGWTQDVQNMMDAAVYTTNVSTLYYNWYRDMIANQTPNGYLGAIVPLEGLQTHDWNCPWWSGMIVYLPWKFYEYYGDRQILEEAYKPMKLYLDFLEQQTKKGISSNTGTYRGIPGPERDTANARAGYLIWGTGDWQGLVSTPISFTSMCAWYNYANIVSKTAGILGNASDAKKYNQLAKSLKEKINARFFDTKTGIYCKARLSQTAQVLPLCLGIVPDGKTDAVLKSLDDAIHTKGDHLSTGFVGMPYLYQALTENNRADLMYTIVNQRDYPGFATLINDGVMKENWKGQHAMMPSLGGSVGMWFYQSLLGIQPDKNNPGFKTFVIKPDMVGDLTWAKGWYNSVYGKITSEWSKSERSISIHITIPANTQARVYLPTTNYAAVTESGTILSNAIGIKLIGIENNKMVLEVTSGDYRFEIIKF